MLDKFDVYSSSKSVQSSIALSYCLFQCYKWSYKIFYQFNLENILQLNLRNHNSFVVVRKSMNHFEIETHLQKVIIDYNQIISLYILVKSYFLIIAFIFFHLVVGNCLISTHLGNYNLFFDRTNFLGSLQTAMTCPIVGLQPMINFLTYILIFHNRNQVELKIEKKINIKDLNKRDIGKR